MASAGKVIFLRDFDEGAEPWMKIRLVYQGELRASQGSPRHHQQDPRAWHKHNIRQLFHQQLKRHWETDRFLSTHTVFPDEYGAGVLAAESAGRWGAEPHEKVPLIEAVADDYKENGYRFVPLVRRDWSLVCSLHILLLRLDTPSSVISAGDLDNRIKTLIDTLTKPTGAAQLKGHEKPEADEDPFFCLLEDDRLVNGLTVETDKLLVPHDIKSDADRSQVQVVVTANVRPRDVTSFNLSFAS